MEAFLPAAPMLVVLIGGSISLVLEGALSRFVRASVQAALTAMVFIIALGLTVIFWSGQVNVLAANSVLAMDGPTWIFWTLLLIFGLFSTFLFAERRVGAGDSPFAASVCAVPSSLAERQAVAARQEHSEVFPLLMFSLGGMMGFTASNDLLMMFVALEIFSFPLYVLAGMARRRRLLSQESALKYFLLGGLSSAIFLYGVALTYGYAGGFNFRDITDAIATSTQSPWLLVAGLGLLSVGVLFKLGAVPFHHWVPDVYTGAPTPVTGFMAVCTKIAAAAGLLRLLYVALGGLRWDWQIVVAAIALLTMLVGAVIGLMQHDVKRVLAYSSIAHAGFILVGVVGAATVFTGIQLGQVDSVEAVWYYLAAYGFATLGAFAIVTTVRRAGSEATGYDAWEGLGRSNPAVGVAMTIFLLSMAGIPLTGGFVGKLLAFIAGWHAGYTWLVFLAVIFSLITAGFYFRIIWLMFAKAPAQQVAVVTPGLGTSAVIWLGVVATLVLGIMPGPLMGIVSNATIFIR